MEGLSLEVVEKAIETIAIGGQSYTIGSRSLTRGDLKTLYAMRKELKAEQAAQTGNGLMGGCYVAEFEGR